MLQVKVIQSFQIFGVQGCSVFDHGTAFCSAFTVVTTGRYLPPPSLPLPPEASSAALPLPPPGASWRLTAAAAPAPPPPEEAAAEDAEEEEAAEGAAFIREYHAPPPMTSARPERRPRRDLTTGGEGRSKVHRRSVVSPPLPPVPLPLLPSLPPLTRATAPWGRARAPAQWSAQS